jgi:CBS domain containing-hemolysin-like protein
MNEIVNRLLLVLVLLGINARFVTAEFSIVAPRRSRIRQCHDQHHAAPPCLKLFKHILKRNDIIYRVSFFRVFQYSSID